MTATNYAQLLRLVWPEIIVVVAALVATAVDLLAMRGRVCACGARRRRGLRRQDARGRCAWLLMTTGQANVFDGMLIANPLTRLVQIAAAGAGDLCAAVLDRRGLYGACGRVCAAGADGDGGDDVSGGVAGPAGDLYLAGAAEPFALCADRVRQAQPAGVGGGAEILFVWRNVGGVSAVRVQPAVRAVELDEPRGHCGRDAWGRAESAAGDCNCDHDDRVWVQGCGGTVSFLGAGCVPGRACAQRGVYCVGVEGGEFLHLLPGDGAGIRGRGGQRGVAALCARVGVGAGDGCGALDGAGQSGGDPAARAAAVAGVLGSGTCGLHAAGDCGAHGAEPGGAAVLRGDVCAGDAGRVWRDRGGGGASRGR